MGVLDLGSLFEGAGRKEAILDANMLVLDISSRVDVSLLHTFKRIKSMFTLEDVALLRWTLSQFREVVTTSYMLSEASNLGNSLTGRQREQWFTELASYGKLVRETHIPTKLLGQQIETIRFGFPDSALKQLSGSTVVITAEHRLSGYLEDRGGQVLNFNHLRLLWMMK
jgi:hypothetical protein